MINPSNITAIQDIPKKIIKILSKLQIKTQIALKHTGITLTLLLLANKYFFIL